MPIATGTRFGPYEILARIGAGGMGEVYKARDTRLQRDVALKISSEKFSDRFERESRVVAALNHPNICQLYDVGPNYLVMELIDGESLQGRLPLEKALDYARQIADGLDAAHEKGIIHRDLKPANIKVTPGGVIKILDFGIAKTTAAAAGGDLENSPTYTMATEAGAILGTAAYMSPEQARGKAVDKRSDIWSFGVVLCEIIAGRRPFDGETASDVVAAILAREPDFEAIPEPQRSIIEKCLRKDPRRRWRDIGDVRMALDESPAVAAAPARSRKNVFGFALAALFGMAALITSILWWRATRPVERPAERFDLPFRAEAALYNIPALSPDGMKIVYLGRLGDGNLGLHVRRLDQPASTPLEGTDDALYPFFSPDGEWIGYFAGGALYKTRAGGGLPVRLAEVGTWAHTSADVSGGSWGDDGNIVFARDSGPLLQIPAAGGQVTQLSSGEDNPRWPQVLAGSDLIVFSQYGSPQYTARIWSRKARRATTLLTGALYARYAASGDLLFVRDNILYAAPMNLRRMEVTSAPVPILENVSDDLLRGPAAFDVSQSGTLAALRVKGNAPGMGVFTLESDGKAGLIAGDFGAEIRLSRNGDRIAFVSTGEGPSRIIISASGLRDAAVHDIAPCPPFLPTWHPDGRHIVFGIVGYPRIYWARADGSGEASVLLEIPGRSNLLPNSFSADGRTMVFTASSRAGVQLQTVQLDLTDPDRPKAGTPQPLDRSPEPEGNGILSADGRWLAYMAHPAGERFEIYVQPFPATGEKWKISEGIWTASAIAWARDLRELYYLGPDARIMAVSYRVTNGSFYADRARVWSQTRIDGSYPQAFDMSPDGKRAVVCLPTEPKDQQAHLTFILNFFGELARRIRG